MKNKITLELTMHETIASLAALKAVIDNEPNAKEISLMPEEVQEIVGDATVAAKNAYNKIESHVIAHGELSRFMDGE